MITIRRSRARGATNLGWLDSRHTFSFDRYIDRDNMSYHALRVINEDKVKPGRGFDEHPHDNMEILTYVIAGAVEHRDSLGNRAVIYPGELQRMTAGTGIYHSEFNHSDRELLHLLQIWIVPEERGLPPSYEQREFPLEERRGEFVLVGSHDGRDESVTIHQDVSVHAGRFDAGSSTKLPLDSERHAWIQVAAGEIAIGHDILKAGDAAAITGRSELSIEARAESEALVFDLV